MFKMAKKREWIILFATFIVSCISLIIYIVSIATSEWVISKATNIGAASPSIINYGLFSGALETYLFATPKYYDLTATCNYGEGACFYSCHQTSEIRQQELERILKGEITEPCTPVERIATLSKLIKQDNVKDDKPNEQYIGSGYWVCTVMFLIIALLFATAAVAFSFFNLYWNPVEPILNIHGLYIWNGVSAGSGLLALIIWGALFEATLKHNIAITDTLQVQSPFVSDGLASLGYSYFIIIISLFLNLGNIGLLFLRRHLLSTSPPPVVIDKVNDDMLTFY